MICFTICSLPIMKHDKSFIKIICCHFLFSKWFHIFCVCSSTIELFLGQMLMHYITNEYKHILYAWKIISEGMLLISSSKKKTEKLLLLHIQYHLTPIHFLGSKCIWNALFILCPFISSVLQDYIHQNGMVRAQKIMSKVIPKRYLPSNQLFSLSLYLYPCVYFAVDLSAAGYSIIHTQHKALRSIWYYRSDMFNVWSVRRFVSSIN